MSQRYKVIDLWSKLNLMKSDKIKECELIIDDEGIIYFEGIDPKDPEWGIDYEEVYPIGWTDEDE